MKVIIHTLNGPETIEGVTKIVDFDNTVVLACEDGDEYNTANDFPTMYRMEVETNG